MAAMKCLVLREVHGSLVLEERPDLQPGPGEVVVRLHAAALNRRDWWITQGMYPGIELPCVLGSDGAGIVTQCGDGVSDELAGQEVVLNPGLDWGDNPAVQDAQFTILGLPADGTFATEIVIDAAQVFPRPGHLDWNESAALPLGGVTAYRAVFAQGRLQAGERVLITGIGGGVATFALQFAVAAGAEVWVTSSSEEKIHRAGKLGARGGFLYTDDTWWKTMVQEAGAPQLIIDSAGGPGYRALLNAVDNGGRIVSYGATAGPPDRLDLFKLFWKQLHLIGSTMGSPTDFQEMLDLVNRHEIHPVIDGVFPLEDGDQAVRKMADSPQFGKYVLSID